MTYFLAYWLALIYPKKTEQCLGQASNTSYYTSRVYAQTTRTNLEESSDVEAVPEAPG